MRLNNSRRLTIAAYAAILGSIYLMIGVAEFAAGLWDLFQPSPVGNLFGLPADIFGGFSALVIGCAYLGGTSFWKGKHESLGFIFVGTLLSAVFGALYLLIVCADGFGTLLASLEGEAWTWEWLTRGRAGSGLLRPEIWLFFVSLPLAYFALRKTKRRGFNKPESRESS
ncbi:MAG: hypothetical protein ACP5KU_07690 [Candidatus Bathyarchaeia archaeon]